MKTLSTFFLLWAGFCTGVVSAQEARTITGRVSDGNDPLEQVRVSNTEADRTTYTAADGTYSIDAGPGEYIHYSYAGMKEYKIRVEDVTRHLNLVMVPDIEELEEVTVAGTNRGSQRDLAGQYRRNPYLIQTAFGIVDARTAPGRIVLVDERQISPVNLCLLDLIRNRFAGISVTGDCQQGGYITIRGPGSVANARVAIYDVDGQIFSDAPLWLDINTIKRMALVSSLAFNARYGSLGGGGVIIINTVNGRAAASSGQPPAAGNRKAFDTGQLLRPEALARNAPTYLKDLQAAPTLEAAKQVYGQYENRYSASPHFFLAAFTYFSARPNGMKFAEQIRSDHFRIFEGNAPMLKALAYRYEELGMEREALELYKEIFILRPHYSQSYLDLGRAYRAAGEMRRAAMLFARYKYLLDEGFLSPSREFGKIMQHESSNLLVLESRAIGAGTRRIRIDPYVEGTTRVVVEWNDSEAEFALQFVNPDGQYTTWEHTYAGMEDRILDEKDNGYSIAEFIIDGNLPGTWTLNADYMGNKSLTPTYLKITTYTNYGERNQQKQVSSVRLQLKNVIRRLASIENPGGSSIR